MSNPLLTPHTLPPFSAIQPEHILPGIETLISDTLATVDTLANNNQPGWDSVIAPIEEAYDRLNSAWSPVGHLNAVANTPELREAYNAALPKLSEYATHLGQHQGLFRAYRSIADSADFASLSVAQQATIEHALRDFRLSGIDLPAEQQQRYADINKRLSELTSQFSNNVLDATQAWTRHITDSSELAGVPQSALDMLAQNAQQQDKEGWLITLDFPSFYPILSFCDNRALREEVYRANVTKASDQGPHAGQFDNTQLMEEILALRQEEAQLLGFANYAELSLATKMAESTEQVVSFLRQLAQRSKTAAAQELAELQAFASSELGLPTLEAWDVGYASEKLRVARYALSQEDLRPYFPAPKVLNGLFTVIGKLYGIDIVQLHDFDTYHADVSFYEVQRDGQAIARFYLDLYARSHKRGGAWMDDCRVRRQRLDGSVQLPIAYLVCNFTPPVGGKPALLTHNEVTTLFHEFGHGLHHMLTKVSVGSVSGINGVAWDAVELPSQFMENWCWEKEALDLISGHYQTGEPLPAELLDKMMAAKNFQAAMMMVRQLEFALFDFVLHRDFQPGVTQVQQVLDAVRAEVAVLVPPSFNRFAHAFTHIFAGGYAAGYYSYKWAEVLSADAFSAFEEEGIFNRQTGERFLTAVLEQGGSKPAMELFKAFRGREPDIGPLLRHSGLAA
ncbi:oligopeptidase A [Pokkaliibacter plantistimulans]|uniref:oligopeptidase A n=1 Tax=Proteobacteria bacterium 228 TaxID=2083153 RepID=A0A2S5KTL7_9PROT|nr:oligopeptidase A [Pokkaliibacter plantistimulans]PPC78207.1 oligopeptidase A [Pokkaliibacter plantistimulans]